MSWTAKIRDWAEWTSTRLKDVNRVPTPRYWRHDVPWFETFLDLLGEEGPPKELHDAFETAVRNDSFAARFVGLDLYHRLAHQDSSPLQDELLDEARRMATDEYRWLVGAVLSSDVPADRRRIDWEVRLASPLRMWDRADALLERLSEASVDSRELDSIRAQHIFLRRYLHAESRTLEEAFRDETVWSSHLVPRAESLEFAYFWIEALASTEPVMRTDLPSAEEVFSTVERGYWADVPSLKPLLLARPSSELGLYDVTIANLNRVLESSSGRQRELVYDALWAAHHQNGNADATKAFLRGWSFEFPNNSSVLLKLANAAADDADYESAYRFLQRAVAAKPELEQDLATRVGLALGEIATENTYTWNEVKAALSRHPALERVMETLVRAYWPSFSALKEHERIEWLTAMYAVHLLTEQTSMLAPAWLRQAGVTFITVAEALLRRAVFAPLRKDATADRAFYQLVRAMRDTNDPNHVLAKYLAARKPVITLSQMLRILDRARSHSFAEPFVALISKHFGTSPILDELEAVRRLELPRNDAVHELTTVNARSIHDDARMVIDAALRHATRPA
jgi:tetratricopeptide (TPR) repeat protein